MDWQRLMPPKGFRVLPRRWVVERTLAWISHNRRMDKDYERLCATGEAFVYAAIFTRSCPVKRPSPRKARKYLDVAYKNTARYREFQGRVSSRYSVELFVSFVSA